MVRRCNLVLLLYIVLIPSLLFVEKALACKGKDVENIVVVLMEVSSWKGLAAKLNIEIGDQYNIESNCAHELDKAKCYRRSLVQKYCDSTGYAIELVAENIAQALEPDNTKQANNIRDMFPSRGKSIGNEQPHSERASPQPPPHTAGTPGPSNGHDTTQPKATFLSLINEWSFMVAVGLAGLAVLVVVILCRCRGEEVRSPQRSEQSHTTINSAASSRSSPSAHSQHSVRRRPVGNIDHLDDPVFDELVTTVRLILIKYTDDNGVEAEFRVKKEIAPKWGDLASLLGLKNAEITSIRQSNHHQDETCTDRMLTKWMDREENHTWRKLIQAINGVQLAHAASVLAKALRKRI